MQLKTFVISFLLVCCQGVLHAQHSAVHVVILGDSNTWIGGDSCTGEKAWTKWFVDAFQPASCRSYARSGATWTVTSLSKRNTLQNVDILADDNVIFNQMFRLEEAIDSGLQPSPDLILINAGTNDAWFHRQRPLRSLQPSIEYVCRELRQRVPRAQIILLTPIPSGRIDSVRLRRVSDVISASGQQMGLHVIRQDTETATGRLSWKEYGERYTTDGIHTNREGARRNGQYIANLLNTIVTE